MCRCRKNHVETSLHCFINDESKEDKTNQVNNTLKVIYSLSQY